MTVYSPKLAKITSAEEAYQHLHGHRRDPAPVRSWIDYLVPDIAKAEEAYATLYSPEACERYVEALLKEWDVGANKIIDAHDHACALLLGLLDKIKTRCLRLGYQQAQWAAFLRTRFPLLLDVDDEDAMTLLLMDKPYVTVTLNRRGL
jgi:hypothetical protein